MAEIQTPKIVTKEREGGTFSAYSNYLEISWTSHDIAILFSEARRQSEVQNADPPIILERKASISMPWSEAKLLRNALTQVIGRFEAANGEIREDPKSF